MLFFFGMMILVEQISLNYITFNFILVFYFLSFYSIIVTKSTLSIFFETHCDTCHFI